MLHKSKGKLKYSHASNGYKLILEVDPNITSFCRWLIPKYIQINPQKYAPHISIVRNVNSINIEFWGKYEGQEVEFEYSNYIHNGKVYWWINAFSVRLEEIRVELGLSIKEEYTEPPDGYVKTFHITLGNNKSNGN